MPARRNRAEKTNRKRPEGASVAHSKDKAGKRVKSVGTKPGSAKSTAAKKPLSAVTPHKELPKAAAKAVKPTALKASPSKTALPSKAAAPKVSAGKGATPVAPASKPQSGKTAAVIVP